ncbi:MAG TPA: alpha-amylase family glycosyl hydrolase [Candidatus Dormibacteraeota bacterium]|nr:alpha-amylase family glycosyl hydrolase [Candidatus Dormibacteraeota bacterium]
MPELPWQPFYGPSWTADGQVRFRIWAPTTARAEVHLADRVVKMRRHRDDTHIALVDGLKPGADYRISLDGDGPFPDPWSRHQPEGVHGPSRLVAPLGRAGHRRVPSAVAQATYELHLGTFTQAGTYLAALKDLPRVRRLGVDTIQLMPVSEFPGRWNWGYDGACFYAPTRAYGSPDDLRELVAGAHREGLAVILDVVYNHLGPDGAYIFRFAPSFFTGLRQTPWGDAIDYHRPEVRRTVADAARWWIQQYGFDGFRLDATHSIFDESPTSILAEIAMAARAAYPDAYLIAEDHRNQAPLVLRDRLDAILADDFHHAVRVMLTGERDNWFADYEGSSEEVATAVADGWIHQGGRQSWAGPGTPTAGMVAANFAFCIENHDQVGNRARARHLASLVTPAQYRAASTLLMLVPERVMLFQGQEWASPGLFNYFTDHHPELGRLVTEGRRREFAAFPEFRDNPENIPDPQAEETFRASRLSRAEQRRNAWAVRLYEELFDLRLKDPVLKRPDREATRAWAEGKVVYLERTAGRRRRLLAVTLLGDEMAEPPPGRVLFHTEERRFGGAGKPTLRTPGAVLVEP